MTCVYEACQVVSANLEWFWRYSLSHLAYFWGFLTSTSPSSAHSNISMSVITYIEYLFVYK